MSFLKNILIVDDDDIILLALSETLIMEGYTVVTCNDPLDALGVLNKKEFGLIISDQRMNHMSGTEFLDACKKIQPNALRILITGVLNLKTIIDAVNAGEIFRFIPKPWIREELLEHVANAFERFSILKNNQKIIDEALILGHKKTLKETQLEFNII